MLVHIPLDIITYNSKEEKLKTGAKGLKVKAANNLVENDCGRFFHCPECHFTADRDYNAAINVYRASFIDYLKVKSLKDTSPIPYTVMGIPHSTVPSGGPEMNCANSLVAVTGIS